MNYRFIIAESWNKTQSDKKLIFWLGFLPAIFTTTVSVIYILYQFFAIKKSALFDNAKHAFSHDVVTFLNDFITNHMSWTLPIVIFGIIFGILYFIIPTLAKASAVQTIARRYNGQRAGISTGIKYGLHSFLPLLEYNLMIHTFSLSGVFIEASFVIRNLGISLFVMLSPIFILFLIIGLLSTLFFIYADFYIIIDDENIFSAIQKSTRLVINNLKHTFLIILLMVFIGIRIIMQIVLILLLPILIVLITGYLATLTHPLAGLIVGGVLGGAGLIITAYLNGIVDVFSYHVWTFTFLEISKEEELSARASV